MNQSTASSLRKLAVGAALAFGLAAVSSSTACSVSVTTDCGGGLVDCNGLCVDLDTSDDNCGGCGDVCPGGTFCELGACVTGSCTPDDSACTADDECCSGFCASDDSCGCILSGDTSTVCSDDIDCCSGSCDFPSGLCN